MFPSFVITFSMLWTNYTHRMKIKLVFSQTHKTVKDKCSTLLSILSHAMVSLTSYCRPKNQLSLSPSVRHTSSNRSFPFHFSCPNKIKKKGQQHEGFSTFKKKKKSWNSLISSFFILCWHKKLWQEIPKGAFLYFKVFGNGLFLLLISTKLNNPEYRMALIFFVHFLFQCISVKR